MIQLTETEIKVIEKHLSGEYYPKGAEMKILDGILQKAIELDKDNESGDDLLQWYYDKYKSQSK